MSSGNSNIFGLVLTGGKSRRMGTDKASLSYGDSTLPQWKRTALLMESCCTSVYISVRPGQKLNNSDPDRFPHIEDGVPHTGPLAGILSAMATHPLAAWLVVACDLPLINEHTIRFLIQNQNPHSIATAFRSANDGLPEPLCSLYNPASREVLQQYTDSGLNCPRKILIREESRVTLLDLPDPRALENANTQEEYKRLSELRKIP